MKDGYLVIKNVIGDKIVESAIRELNIAIGNR